MSDDVFEELYALAATRQDDIAVAMQRQFGLYSRTDLLIGMLQLSSATLLGESGLSVERLHAVIDRCAVAPTVRVERGGIN